MLEFVHAVHYLGTRVAGPDLLVKLGIHGDVNVLVDGGADYCSHFVVVKGGQIAASPHKADSQWRSRDNHVFTPFGCSV